MFTTKRFGNPPPPPPTEDEQIEDMLATFQSYGVFHALAGALGFIVGMMFGVVLTTPANDPYAGRF
jgi:hypothetical protein